MGLLLDANQIPIGMKMYPGNKSEKPVIREIIDELKQRSHISGRTIQVADKRTELLQQHPSCPESRRRIYFLKICKNASRNRKNMGTS